MSAIKDFFSNLKYNTEGKVALASIIVNIILIAILLNMLCTGEVPGYTSRAELEAQATECTLEHVDPNATTTTTEVTDESTEDDTSSTTSGNNTTKNNGNTTKKTTTTTTKSTTTTTKNSGDNDVEWPEGWY